MRTLYPKPRGWAAEFFECRRERNGSAPGPIRAGALAKALAPSFTAKIAELQRELEAWQIGFEALRARSLELLRKVRTDRHESAVTLNQAVKGAAVRSSGRP